jgi:hypothetical protein
LEPRRVNVDFPAWVVTALDREAARLGVTRQALIKMSIADRIEQAAYWWRSNLSLFCRAGFKSGAGASWQSQIDGALRNVSPQSKTAFTSSPTLHRRLGGHWRSAARAAQRKKDLKRVYL